jgi:excisionase family DNA binding protein
MARLKSIERMSYGVTETAVLLGCSTDTIRRWIRGGRLAYVRLGVNSKILIPRTELERVLREGQPVISRGVGRDERLTNATENRNGAQYENSYFAG